jgi:hypothetical protein
MNYAYALVGARHQRVYARLDALCLAPTPEDFIEVAYWISA